MSLYLGLDCSTQSLTGILLQVEASEKHVLFRHTLQFDAELPSYGTKNGVLPSSDPAVATSPPALWAAALDRFMEILTRRERIDLSRLRAVSGAAQQHGSVYLNGSATERLRALDGKKPLAAQVPEMLSRTEAPIWMDTSTMTECAEITAAVGGTEGLLQLTGSRAFERFTGPQIRKFSKRHPSAYAATDRIHLVSSFLGSLLTGAHAPIDHGDGAGMNLMDLRAKAWSDRAVEATAPGLAAKLPPLVPSHTVIGQISPYWTERHGLPSCDVVAWTGDNLASLIGVGLVDPDRRAISLGTSDTVFGLLGDLRVDPSGTSHVFGAPTGGYMALTCFRNGSLARERVRDAYGLDWEGFSNALRSTPAANRGAIMLPWFEPEITPPVSPAVVHRFGLDTTDAPANVRAVVEAQMIAMAIHTTWMGSRASGIHATGGAAQNRGILQIMADVHEADVYRFAITDSAALGAALRAYHAQELAAGHAITWQDVVAGIAVPDVSSRITPIPEHVGRYRDLRRVYAMREAEALRHVPRR
ncbi:MAG TPA: FGGY family carbohydrate kinase [Gemmatimonadales bacterium]|jgi:xylulokinase